MKILLAIMWLSFLFESNLVAAENSIDSIQAVRQSIYSKLLHNWRFPKDTKAGTEAKATITLYADGTLRGIMITQPSGDNSFDRMILASVARIGVFEEVRQVDSASFDKYFRSFHVMFKPEGFGSSTNP